MFSDCSERNAMFSGVMFSVLSAGDVMFNIRSAPAVSSWPSFGRCSSGALPDPAPASPAPVLLSCARRGRRRRLVTACPLPADPRLTGAAGHGSSPAPPLSQPTPASSVITAPVRASSGRTHPTLPLLPLRGDSPVKQTLSRKASAAARPPPWSVAPPIPWTGRLEPWSVSDQTSNTRECTVPGHHNGLAAPVITAHSDGRIAEPNPVQSTQKTGGIQQTNRKLPDPFTQTAESSSRSAGLSAVSFPRHRTGPIANPSRLFPVLSPSKTGTFSRSEASHITSSHQKSGAVTRSDVQCPGERIPFPHQPPTSRCRLTPVRRPACGPPAPPARGPPVLTPGADGPTSAFYPYPWLVSSE